MSTSFTAPVGESKQREIVPSGNHIATCYQIVDLGTVEGQWEGQPTFKRKIRLTFELPDEQRVFNEEKGMQPMVISREFGLSMHENSALRPFVEGWIGKKMSDEEARKFDLHSLLGKAGLLNAVHRMNESATYANISGMTPLMKGMAQPQAYNPQVLVHFNDFANFNWDGYNSLPKFLQDILAKSPEWQNLQNWMAKEAEKEKTTTKKYDSDDLPF